MVCKLHNIKKHNEDLQVRLDEALEKNKEILQEREQQDIEPRDMQCKLQGMQEKYRALQMKHNKTTVASREEATGHKIERNELQA